MEKLVSMFCILIILSCGLALLVSSCVVSTPCLAENKVGVILPMTGEFARYGDKIRQGIESQKPASVEYVYEDEGCNPRAAVSAFHKLNGMGKIRVFLGPWCGSPQVAVASLLQKAGGLAILGTSAPERVYQLSSGRMLAVQPSIEMESRFNAQEAYRLGARRAVVVFLENDFSRAHEAAFREAFKGEVLETLTYPGADASALRAIATKIKQLDPDLLYIPDAFPLMHGLTKHLWSLGLRRLRLMSVYSAQSDDVLSVVGSTGEGVLYSYPDILEDALHFYPRLAMQVLAYALEECTSADPDCMKKAVYKKYPFNQQGVLPGAVRLKTIRDGAFQWYKP